MERNITRRRHSRLFSSCKLPLKVHFRRCIRCPRPKFMQRLHCSCIPSLSQINENAHVLIITSACIEEAPVPELWKQQPLLHAYTPVVWLAGLACGFVNLK